METQTQTRSKLWTWDFIKLGMARLFYSIAIQVLQTIFPIFLAARGFTASAIGMVATMYTASSMIMRFASGRMVDTSGRRKVGVMGAIFLSLGTLACILTIVFESSLSTSFSIGALDMSLAMLLIIVARCVHGLGNSTINISNTTMFADILPPDRFAEGIGYSGLFNSLSTAIGPAIGIALIAMSANVTFGSVFIASVLSLILLNSMKYESDPAYIQKTKKEDAETKEEEYKGIWVYFEKRSIPAGVILFVLAIASAAATNFLALYTKEIGLAGVGYYFTFKAIFMIITRLMSGKMTTRFGIYRIIEIGLVITAIGYIGIPFATNSAMLYVCAAFDGFGCGMAYPGLSVLTLNGVPRKRRGIANSTYLITWDLGVGVGAMIWGAMIDSTGTYTIIFTLSGIALLADFLVSIWLSKRYPERPAH